MEGIQGAPDPRSRRLDQHGEVQLVHRWVAFMFLVMFGLVLVIYFSAAAFYV